MIFRSNMDMEYRKIGNTGMSASIIGLGTEYLDNQPYAVVEETIRAALEHGINMIDLFMPGDTVRTLIGKALGSDRKKVIIQGHVGSVDLREQYDMTRDLDTCKRYFDKLLACLGTDYIDVGMLFFMDSDESLREVFENGIVDYVTGLKKQGVIRAIGASSHNPVLARKLAGTGILDLLMFSINPAFDLTPATTDVLSTFEEGNFAAQEHVTRDPVRADLYKYCEQQGIAITVMKTLGGGRLLSAENSPFGKAMTVPQCIHYALTRPAVVSTLIGCQSRRQVIEAVSYLDTTRRQRDYTGIISGYQGDFRGNCLYCNHCQPCPMRIDIASVHKYLDISRTQTDGVPPSILQHYRSLSAHASDCVSCGNCQNRCPFSVPVIENMAKAAALFGM